MALDLIDLIPDPGCRPHDWQLAGAPEVFGSKPPVKRSPDLARVVALPRRDPLEPGSPTALAMIEMMTRRFGRENPHCQCSQIAPVGTRDCITRLREIQAWSLYEIGISQGLLGLVGVGHGKTLIDLLAPFACEGCKTALLFIPSNVVDQFMLDYVHVGQHFVMPSLVVHGRNRSNIVPGAPVLHVLPYSRLQRAPATDFLERLAPDLIIADEAHNLSNLDAAGASRVLRYMMGHPAARFISWSGSMSDDSIEDYAHLSYFGLRQRSPLPMDSEVIKEWASAIDPPKTPGDWPAPPGALLEFCAPGEHVQEGFHRRLVDTLGVVHTQTSAIDAELQIDEREPPEMPENLAAMLDDVRETWIRPDGETLVDQLSVARCCRELAAGFYYRWRFPLVNGVPQRKEQIEKWMSVRQAWNSELRKKLAAREEHLDSALLCARAASRFYGYDVAEEVASETSGDAAGETRRADRVSKLPVWESKFYPAWRAIRTTVVYETEAIRVSDYLARDAAQWALENHGIVWYGQKEFGKWVAELSGLPLHGGGPDAGRRIAQEAGRTSIICSIQSHGTGRNGLQKLYHRQLVANPMSSGSAWEQLLGRLYRIGQKAPRVYASFYRHTKELAQQVDRALARALYVQRTLGASQKFLMGFQLGDRDVE